MGYQLPCVFQGLLVLAGGLAVGAILHGVTYGTPELARFTPELVEFAVGGELLERIDKALEEPQEEFISEALAWRGVLPMFGFPTGMRSLYTKAPYTDRDGRTIESTVDRDIEIAISEFAPAAEVIKDKRTHHVVGLASYRRETKSGQTRIVLEELGDLLGKEQEIAYCNLCRRPYDQLPLPAACESCQLPLSEDKGAGFQRLHISSPKGFRTDYRPSDGRPGEEERTYASTARPVIPDPGGAKPHALHATYWAATGDFYTINDNDGRLLTFQGMPGQGWIEDGQMNRPGIYGNSLQTLTRALYARKRSEALVVEPTELDADLQMRIGFTGVRATLYSFGFLLQRAAATLLDVDQREFSVGLRSHFDPDTPQVSGHIYLADSLANGAGYARQLSEGDHLEHLLMDVAEGPHSKLLRGMAGHFNDPSTCDSSCYKCLRSYQNMRYHGLLNWRLARDMARLLVRGKLDPLPDAAWEAALSKAMPGLGDKFAPHRFGGLPALQLQGQGTIAIFSHPLLKRYPASGTSEPVAEAQAEAESLAPSHRIVHLTYFDLIHRPWWAVGCILAGRNLEEDPVSTEA